MKKTAIMMLAMSMASMSHAAIVGYRTAGDGQTYSFETLSQTEGTGVTKESDHVYIITGSDTISSGDHFQIDEGAEIRFGDDAELIVYGTAHLESLTARTLLTRDGASETCHGIYLWSEVPVSVRGLDFEYIGLYDYSGEPLHITDCTFSHHNGSAAAALYFVSGGGKSTIENCRFEYCQRAAIGSAANASHSLSIVSCVLTQNSTANQNIPQINIAAAEEITIQDCEIMGHPDDPSINNMVGGIGISNYFSADNQILISSCQICDNRYGIGTVGPTNIRIENCTLDNNNHESNPMNGGSGISLYDPYLKTQAVIAGNHIAGNYWGITVIGCQNVNIGKPYGSDVLSPGENTFKDNGFNGQLYDLYNNSTNTIYAQNNTWNVAEQTEEQIETVIYHKHDDPSLGEVIFMPAKDDSHVDHLRQPNSSDAATYTIGGIRTTNPSAGRKGIYIQHGKKTVVR